MSWVERLFYSVTLVVNYKFTIHCDNTYNKNIKNFSIAYNGAKLNKQ